MASERSYRLTQQAEEDLLTIWRYRAEHSPASATALMRNFHQQFALLADFPHLGKARPELRPGLRSFPHAQHSIFYYPKSDGVEVARVVHASRDLSGLFNEPDDLN